MKPVTEHLAGFVGGFIAGEGMFLGKPPNGFVCAVAVGATDADSVEMLCDFLGVGYVRRFPRRKPHYDDEARWTVRKLRDLVEVILPFMDVHLPVSHKRVQYLAWRAALLDYWEHGARRRRTCSAPGCDRPHRAHGWCRHHLYIARGM